MRHPNVPESVEGWWILHRLYSFDRISWDRLDQSDRDEMIAEAQSVMAPFQKDKDSDLGLAQMLGHKADLMLTHYSRDYEGLARVQIAIDKLRLCEYLLAATSYVSVLELGMYEGTAKAHAAMAQSEHKAGSPEWNAAFDLLIQEQSKAPHFGGRLWARIPQRRFVCFYPMDKKRGEDVNWYMMSYEDRGRMMLDHGKIGRTYHGLVTQVISGSIGFDAFEWGVDLYADDPMVFKKLIYEMRFDEASARYGDFGDFFSGVQFSLDQLATYLNGTAVPALNILQPV